MTHSIPVIPRNAIKVSSFWVSITYFSFLPTSTFLCSINFWISVSSPVEDKLLENLWVFCFSRSNPSSPKRQWKFFDFEVFLFQIRFTQKRQGWFFSTKSQEKASHFCLTFWFKSSSFWSVHRNSDSLNVPKVPMKLNFLDLQLHVSPKLRTWFVPSRSKMTVFRLWQSNNMNDVDFLFWFNYMFKAFDQDISQNIIKGKFVLEKQATPLSALET